MTKQKRKGISKKIRFEVFKRDSFTCQYCGRKAPDIILELDHINPVANGGDGDIMNLVTSCEDCNAGKRDRLLSDNSVLEKQREQIETLQKRREQIDMMLEWRESLLTINDYETDKIIEFINNRIQPYTLKPTVKEIISSYKKKFGFEGVISAVEIAAGQYLKFDQEKPTIESVDKMLEKIPGIAFNAKKWEAHPEQKIIDFLRFELCRTMYLNVRVFYILCNQALKVGVTADEIKELSSNVRNWTDWKSKMESLIVEIQDGKETLDLYQARSE